MKYQSVVKSEGELMNAWKERLIEYIKTLDDAVPLEEVKKLKSHWLFHVSFDNIMNKNLYPPFEMGVRDLSADFVENTKENNLNVF